jgi:hypothetical protein
VILHTMPLQEGVSCVGGFELNVLVSTCENKCE